jgi:hypothetical protein
MKKWWKEGERLILCVDANENIYWGELGWQLTDLDGLGMKEVVGEFTAKQLGATYFQGSEPIDGIWATGNLTVTNACIMPVGFGVGDHQLFVIDFATTTLVGSVLHTIVHPALCRLNTKINGCAQWYKEMLQRNILCHCLLERLVTAAFSSRSKEEVSKKLNKLDQEGEAYMKHVKKKCRWLKSGRIPFSPEASLWIRQWPSLQVPLALACQEDKESGEPETHCPAVPDQHPIPALGGRHQAAPDNMQREVQLFL